MAKSKNKGLPHHVKERLRHQNLQKILENVASHVPKPSTTKKETKAKKLRRVVLYMKYLIHTKEKLDETKNAIKSISKFQDSAVKSNVTFSKLSSGHKSKRKRAQIVFLSKLSDESANKEEGITTLKHQKCCKNELQMQAAKNPVNAINKSSPKNILLENASKLTYSKSNKSATDLADRYVPNMEMENGSDYNVASWKEDCSTVSRSNAEKKIDETGSNCITKDHNFNEYPNYCIREKEKRVTDLDRNGTDLEQYIQEFSKDLEKMHGSFSPDTNLYMSDKLGKRSANVYNREKGMNFNYICSNVQVDKHQHSDKASFSQNSDNFSLKDTSTATPSSSFEMPVLCNNSDLKMDKQCSKHKMLSQKSINSSSDIFSSGESGAFATLHSITKPHILNFSARQKNDQPIHCDVTMDKRQFSKHPSFSQSSDNFSSDIFSSGESGTFISSNEYVLSENEHIGFADPLLQNANASPSRSLRPESTMDEENYDFSRTLPQRNCDIITSPDLFCDMKPDTPHGISDFSVDNILSNSCYKNPFSPNSERCFDYNIHGPNYNIPIFHNSAYNNVVDSRFFNYFGMNNYSQNLPFHALPRFSAIRNYPTMKMGDFRRYSDGMPGGNFMVDTDSPERVYDYNHSMYANEDMGNHLGVCIKQEDPEPFLPPEELSYSLNNFTNSGYC